MTEYVYVLVGDVALGDDNIYGVFTNLDSALDFLQKKIDKIDYDWSQNPGKSVWTDFIVVKTPFDNPSKIDSDGNQGECIMLDLKTKKIIRHTEELEKLR